MSGYQESISSHFSYKIFGAKTSNPKHSCVIFGAKILYIKCRHKTLLKLTPGGGVKNKIVVLFALVILLIHCTFLSMFQKWDLRIVWKKLFEQLLIFILIPYSLCLFYTNLCVGQIFFCLKFQNSEERKACLFW